MTTQHSISISDLARNHLPPHRRALPGRRHGVPGLAPFSHRRLYRLHLAVDTVKKISHSHKHNVNIIFFIPKTIKWILPLDNSYQAVDQQLCPPRFLLLLLGLPGPDIISLKIFHSINSFYIFVVNLPGIIR